MFVDSDFLYKKIILDQKKNVFKTTFYDIKKIVVEREKIYVDQYLNSFLNCLLSCKAVDSDVEKYCYDFTSFILDSVDSKKGNPFGYELFPCVFACILISKLSNNFIYKRQKNFSRR